MISLFLAALFSLLRFLGWLLLGLLTGLLVLLPWLLRLGAVCAWLSGLFWVVLALQAAYGPHTASLPLWALVAAAAWLFAAWPVVIVSRPTGRQRLWGALYLSGLISLALHQALLAASPLLVQAAPVLLAAVLSFMLTLRFRRMRETQPTQPGAFTTPDNST